MEELTELFVAENKLSVVATDIKTLPAVSITKVASDVGRAISTRHTGQSNICHCLDGAVIEQMSQA